MKKILSLALLASLSGCNLLPFEHTLSSLRGKPVSKVVASLGNPQSTMRLTIAEPARQGTATATGPGADLPMVPINNSGNGKSLWSWTSPSEEQYRAVPSQAVVYRESEKGRTSYTETRYTYESAGSVSCTMELVVGDDGIIYGYDFQTEVRSTCEWFQFRLPAW